jgi:hypothetical protein
MSGESDVNKAVEAAVQAFPIWSSKTQAERSKAVREIARGMKDIIPELVRLDVLEHVEPPKQGGLLGHIAHDLSLFTLRREIFITVVGDPLVPICSTSRFMFLLSHSVKASSR